MVIMGTEAIDSEGIERTEKIIGRAEAFIERTEGIKSLR